MTTDCVKTTKDRRRFREFAGAAKATDGVAATPASFAARLYAAGLAERVETIGLGQSLEHSHARAVCDWARITPAGLALSAEIGDFDRDGLRPGPHREDCRGCGRCERQPTR